MRKCSPSVMLSNRVTLIIDVLYMFWVIIIKHVRHQLYYYKILMQYYDSPDRPEPF
jgi:hypothetical protein